MALKLDKENRVIAGVCAGIANEMNVKPIVIRLAFVLGFLAWGIGPIIYLIMWLVLALQEK